MADTFATRLTALRERAKLTRHQLALAADLHPPQVYRLEDGSRGDPTLTTATALAKALDKKNPGRALEILSGLKPVPIDT